VADAVRPEFGAFSVERSVALLSRPQTRAARAQGLFTSRMLRLGAPAVVREVADPGSLTYVRVVGGELRIGLLTRLADLAGSTAGGHAGILREIAEVLGDRTATIGGVLCQADPVGPLLAVLVAARASMVIKGRYGTRTVPAGDFRCGPHETAAGSGELLTEIRVPAGPHCST
jgi:aerobic carbon-monoxide dehydrogenase medium subunit